MNLNSVRSLARLFTAGCAVALVAGLAPTPASAAVITFNLAGGGGTGTVGNTRTFTSGGVTVTATAWSYVSNFQPSALGQWSVGLGVCNASELSSGGCTSPEHEVDNSSTIDFVLFRFSTAVDPTSVSITTTSHDDLDASYWTGDLTLPSDGLKNDTYAMLGSRGFGARLDSDCSGSATSRTVALTSGFVNGLLFGARVGGSNDAFKISSLVVNTPQQVTVPEPAALLVFGLGMLGMAPRLRRRAVPPAAE